MVLAQQNGRPELAIRLRSRWRFSQRWLISTASGALSGAVIAVFDVQPFVVTLAGMIGIRGLAKWLSNNANVDVGFGQDVASTFAAIFRGKAVTIGCYVLWRLCSRFC